MKYKYNSDITNVKEGVIAHGVNCQMRMGSGVAKALYEKWPKVKESYHNMKRATLGDVQIFWVEDKELAVANCFTQEFYGYDDKVYADLESILHCLNIVHIYHPGPINIPKIGCGLGGLDWEVLEKELLRMEEDTPELEFIVHTLGES